MQSFQTIVVGLLAVAILAGCATKSPPAAAEIRQQALTNVTLPAAWKAGGKTGSIGDDWAKLVHRHRNAFGTRDFVRDGQCCAGVIDAGRATPASRGGQRTGSRPRAGQSWQLRGHFETGAPGASTSAARP